jgi:hypothetical protein
VLVGIDTGREQRVHVDHPTALPHQRVGGDEGVGAGVQRPGRKGNCSAMSAGNSLIEHLPQLDQDGVAGGQHWG